MVKYVFLLMSFILAGCSLGLDGTLGRTTADPFDEIPAVQSFNGDISIVISWNRDEAADEYYLWRAADNISPWYELVYHGNLTEYRNDFSLPDDNSPYLYRLSKRRGGKFFNDPFNNPVRGKAGLGVASSGYRDIFEPNNDNEHATVLQDTEFLATCWYYESNTTDGINIYDDDWYCVDLPPHWVAEVILTDLSKITMDNVEHFKIQQFGAGPKDITSGNPEEIHNASDFPGRFYFHIFPNFEKFQYYHLLPSSGGSGAFINYTIRISALRPE